MYIGTRFKCGNVPGDTKQISGHTNEEILLSDRRKTKDIYKDMPGLPESHAKSSPLGGCILCVPS